VRALSFFDIAADIIISIQQLSGLLTDHGATSLATTHRKSSLHWGIFKHRQKGPAHFKGVTYNILIDIRRGMDDAVGEFSIVREDCRNSLGQELIGPPGVKAKEPFRAVGV
jgi:hypothetical protein